MSSTVYWTQLVQASSGGIANAIAVSYIPGFQLLKWAGYTQTMHHTIGYLNMSAICYTMKKLDVPS